MTTDTDCIRKNNQEGLQVGDFKVGDRVRWVGTSSLPEEGATGVITGVEDVEDPLFRVTFDNDAGHTWAPSPELEQTEPATPAPDVVAHPPHYVNHPSGIECIQITEHMGFNLGNAVKYIWRCDLKQDAIEDLRKSIWYIEREIAKREAA